MYVMAIDILAFVIWQCREQLTLCRGEQEHLTCYNLFTAGGVSLQGEFSYTQVVIIKKVENVEAYKIERF